MAPWLILWFRLNDIHCRNKGVSLPVPNKGLVPDLDGPSFVAPSAAGSRTGSLFSSTEVSFLWWNFLDGTQPSPLFGYETSGQFPTDSNLRLRAVMCAPSGKLRVISYGNREMYKDLLEAFIVSCWWYLFSYCLQLCLNFYRKRQVVKWYPAFLAEYFGIPISGRCSSTSAEGVSDV